MDADKAIALAQLTDLFPYILAITAVAVGGWVVTTWLRIKHGYPLENSWGRAICSVERRA